MYHYISTMFITLKIITLFICNTGYEGLDLQALTPLQNYQIWTWSCDLQI